MSTGNSNSTYPDLINLVAVVSGRVTAAAMVEWQNLSYEFAELFGHLVEDIICPAFETLNCQVIHMSGG